MTFALLRWFLMRVWIVTTVIVAGVLGAGSAQALELQAPSSSSALLVSARADEQRDSRPRSSYAIFSREIQSIARQARRYVAPGKGMAAIGVNFVREQRNDMKINLRGGVATSFRNPRAGVQLDISW